MPRRPGGGHYPAESVEGGLRDLVLEQGPDVRLLSRRATPGLAALMRAANPPDGWRSDVAAAAVIQVIVESLGEIPNERWRAAAQAALRIPDDDYVGSHGDSLAARWKRLADLQGESGEPRKTEAYRGYWIACAHRLAAIIEDRFEALKATPGGWDRYRKIEPKSPPRLLPISFDRTDVLYRFEGRRGMQSTSYRWLTAHGPVDHYDAVGYYYNEPNAPIDIIPLANCEMDGAVNDLPIGGRMARLVFSRELREGERYFFAYSTLFNSSQPCRPTILYEVRGMGMDILTVRVQFDRRELPRRLWRFDVEAQDEGWQKPDDGAPELLAIAPNGYVQCEFSNCHRNRKYGVRWEWND